MIHFFADSNGHNLALPEHRQSHHLALPPMQCYPVWLYYQSTYHEIITHYSIFPCHRANHMSGRRLIHEDNNQVITLSWRMLLGSRSKDNGFFKRLVLPIIRICKVLLPPKPTLMYAHSLETKRISFLSRSRDPNVH